MIGGTVVLRREVLDKVGMFDVNFPAAENWDLWLRVSKHYEADFVDAPLVKYRKHAGNMSTDSELMLGVIGTILDKHCKSEQRSTEDTTLFQTAYANYAYRKGIYHCSKNEYRIARGNFREALEFVPNYEDTRVRLIRTYLGKSGNNFISNVKSLVLRLRHSIPG